MNDRITGRKLTKIMIKKGAYFLVSKSSSKLECRETIIRNFKSEWTEEMNLKISWTNEINSKDIFFDKYQLIATSPTATYQKVNPLFSQSEGTRVSF